MSIRSLPLPSVPVVDANGLMTREWYAYFRDRERVGLSNLPDVLLTTLADTQVLIWDGTALKWKNGAN